MSFLKVDARGLACPKPVLETKKALKDLQEEGIITTVDNQIAVENVKKLVKKLGYTCEVNENKDDFDIKIFNNEENVTISSSKDNELKNQSILFSSNKMGNGNDELGEVLMNGYIYTLTEMDELPKYIMFVNSGVKLTTKGSKCIEDLKKLEDRGVEVLSCGTCLNYLNIDLDNLEVGSVTNMYTIVDNTVNVDKTIKMG